MSSKSAVCRYKNLTDDERIRMIAEEKAWKDRQIEIKCAIEEGIQKGKAEGRDDGEYSEKIKNAINIFQKNKSKN